MRRALCLLFVGACALPPAPLVHDQRIEPLRLEREQAPREEGLLRVRLSAQEGVSQLAVFGTEDGVVEVRPSGRMLRTSAGELVESLTLHAATDKAGLEIDERLYPGKLRVGVHPTGGLYVENLVDLEDYIAGVVPAELVLWSARESEIEAQAIAARTYALRSLAKRRLGGQAFLWDDTRDQVYLGSFRAEDSAGARRVAARLERALESSRGRVLQNSEGELYDVRFHASCGGYATSPAEAFPFESVWHHAPVRCEPCARIGAEEAAWTPGDGRRRQVHWSYTVPGGDLAELGTSVGLAGTPHSFAMPQLDRHQRWQSVELRSRGSAVRISVEELRRNLGAAELKSGRIIKVWPALGQPIEGGVFFEGLGRGHGAGLCQVGSHAHAEAGWDAERILKHYLPGSSITSLPPTRLSTLHR